MQKFLKKFFGDLSVLVQELLKSDAFGTRHMKIQNLGSLIFLVQKEADV